MDFLDLDQNLLYKAEKPSVSLSACIFGTLITQQSLHGLKQDLFELKAEDHRVYFYKPTEPTVH